MPISAGEQVELPGEDCRRADQRVERRLPYERVEGAVCLVEPLLSPHAGADGVVRVTDGALEVGVAQEDMPGVVRGLQHAGDDRLFPGVDHRGPADFDVPAVLKGPVAAGELAAQ